MRRQCVQVVDHVRALLVLAGRVVGPVYADQPQLHVTGLHQPDLALAADLELDDVGVLLLDFGPVDAVELHGLVPVVELVLALVDFELLDLVRFVHDDVVVELALQEGGLVDEQQVPLKEVVHVEELDFVRLGADQQVLLALVQEHCGDEFFQGQLLLQFLQAQILNVQIRVEVLHYNLVPCEHNFFEIIDVEILLFQVQNVLKIENRHLHVLVDEQYRIVLIDDQYFLDNEVHFELNHLVFIVAGYVEILDLDCLVFK